MLNEKQNPERAKAPCAERGSNGDVEGVWLKPPPRQSTGPNTDHSSGKCEGSIGGSGGVSAIDIEADSEV
jgi:hypothetical protein